MLRNAHARLVVRFLAVTGVVLSMLFAGAAPMDFAKYDPRPAGK